MSGLRRDGSWRTGHSTFRLLFDRWQLYIRSQLESCKQTDGQIGEVYLPPSQAMGGRPEESVMVVVPSLSVGENGDPPVVGGFISGGPDSVTPCMGGRVDKPRAVPHKNSAEEYAPDHEGPAAPEIEDDSQYDLVYAMGGIHESIDRITSQVGRVIFIFLIDIEGFIKSEKPAHMGPPESFGGAVGVVGLIRIGMVQSVNSNPFDGPVLVS